MAETEAVTVNDEAAGGDAPIVAAPVKGKKVKAADKGVATKKPKTKPNHPPTSEMVQNAIKSLKERGGSSLQAIKKYISATYKIDADKLSPFIKKYIKSAVIGGQLVQTKGKGASGSFRLPTAAKPKQPKKSTAAATSKPKAVKKSTAKSAAEDKKPKAVVKKESTIRKPVPPKKPAEEKRKVAAAPAKVAKKADVKTTKQKPTKPVKSDAVKKLKTPKPKKSSGGAAKKAKK